MPPVQRCELESAYQRLDASTTPHLDAVSVAIHEARQKLRAEGRKGVGFPHRMMTWL